MGFAFTEAAQMTVARRGGPIEYIGESYSDLYDRGDDYVNEQYRLFGFTAFAENFTFGAASAEVEVDRETGSVRILRAYHAYDCGFAVNPLAVEGQIEGGAAISIGSLASEEVIMDGGQIMNPCCLHYKMLTALDMPNTMPFIVETVDPYGGPFGTKELGMGTIGAPGVAVVSAIYHATGIMLKEFPTTPARILKALEGKR